MTSVKSESDQRTVNNSVRHQYRVLTEEEKASMLKVKDSGAEFIAFLDSLAPSREVSIAKTKVEEAVMWAVKSITT